MAVWQGRMSGVVTPNFLYDYLDIMEERCALGRPWWLWATLSSVSSILLLLVS